MTIGNTITKKTNGSVENGSVTNAGAIVNAKSTAEPMNARRIISLCLPCIGLAVATSPLAAQDSTPRYGEGVPPAVRLINKRALTYLAGTQQADGSWEGQPGGSGVTGICLMALMASGEDPDFGPYAESIRKAVRNLIISQNGNTGHITGRGHGSMYHHGFATLALSEAYGVVNERLLWKDSDIAIEDRRSIGQALELAVRCAVTAQKKNPFKAWRYSPDSQDADTTVSGTVLMGLLGARNAGIEIPNHVVENAISYFKINTMGDGDVSYQPAQSHGSGIIRTAIATLVYAIAKRKDSEQYKAAARSIKQRMDQDISEHPFYGRYYLAQALFQSDVDAWKAWNHRTIAKLQKMQAQDGSFQSNHGTAYGTAMSVLALALNYRLLPVYER